VRSGTSEEVRLLLEMIGRVFQTVKTTVPIYLSSEPGLDESSLLIDPNQTQMAKPSKVSIGELLYPAFNSVIPLFTESICLS
jgi:hypothetical protein